MFLPDIYLYLLLILTELSSKITMFSNFSELKLSLLLDLASHSSQWDTDQPPYLRLPPQPWQWQYFPALTHRKLSLFVFQIPAPACHHSLITKCHHESLDCWVKSTVLFLQVASGDCQPQSHRMLRCIWWDDKKTTKCFTTSTYLLWDLQVNGAKLHQAPRMSRK